MSEFTIEQLFAVIGELEMRRRLAEVTLRAAQDENTKLSQDLLRLQDQLKTRDAIDG